MAELAQHLYGTMLFVHMEIISMGATREQVIIRVLCISDQTLEAMVSKVLLAGAVLVGVGIVYHLSPPPLKGAEKSDPKGDRKLLY
jgi:hypothetical protein